MFVDIEPYDYIIVAFSGGKDSIACFLHLLDLGVPKSKIELWHHYIDGHEGSELMDWPVTGSYCQAFAKAFGVSFHRSWKVGGFEREMLRENAKTAPIKFEDQDDNIVECGGVRGNFNTRRKFPQVSADLSVRWCSAYLKIDVCTRAINNQDRFLNKRTLVITGERAEESSARAKYKTFEPDRSDRRNGTRKKRHVDHWRPVHGWLEDRVWTIIKKYKVNPHPAYKLGWGRLSCAACIFGSMHQWASLNAVNPERVKRIAELEEEFELTIHRTRPVSEQIARGIPYVDMDPGDILQALSKTYIEPIILNQWKQPKGAYGENTGPS